MFISAQDMIFCLYLVFQHAGLSGCLEFPFKAPNWSMLNQTKACLAQMSLSVAKGQTTASGSVTVHSLDTEERATSVSCIPNYDACF
jgi:hypothetical protein